MKRIVHIGAAAAFAVIMIAMSPLAAVAGSLTGVPNQAVALGPVDNNVGINPFPNSAQTNLTAYISVDPKSHKVFAIITKLALVNMNGQQVPSSVHTTRLAASAKRVNGALVVKVRIPAGIKPLGILGQYSFASKSTQHFGVTRLASDGSHVSTFKVPAGAHLEFVNVSANNPQGYQPSLPDVSSDGLG